MQKNKHNGKQHTKTVHLLRIVHNFHIYSGGGRKVSSSSLNVPHTKPLHVYSYTMLFVITTPHTHTPHGHTHMHHAQHIHIKTQKFSFNGVFSSVCNWRLLQDLLQIWKCGKFAVWMKRCWWQDIGYSPVKNKINVWNAEEKVCTKEEKNTHTHTYTWQSTSLIS